MAEPVNDVMAEKIYIKIAMVFFTLVGLAGGSMSIAGPVVGLTLNPNELTAANFQQVERFGLDAALYFDCGEHTRTHTLVECTDIVAHPTAVHSSHLAAIRGDVDR